MSDPEAMQGLLGDLDRTLAAAPGSPEERALALTEGALPLARRRRRHRLLRGEDTGA